MTYTLTLTDSEDCVLNRWEVSLFLQETQEPTLNMLKISDKFQLLDEICSEIAFLERTQPADKKDHRIN